MDLSVWSVFGRGGGLSVRNARAVMRDNVVRANSPNDVEEIPR
ncbi:MAG: hypothetical protein AABY85_08055 [Gemmatimonadota bacterium]